MHPLWLRCSSLKYSRYSRSSRLAGGAPRPSRCDARLSPRAAGQLRRFALGCAGNSFQCYAEHPWSSVDFLEAGHDKLRTEASTPSCRRHLPVRSRRIGATRAGVDADAHGRPHKQPDGGKLTINDGIGQASEASSGILTLKVRLFPSGGGHQDGVLTVNCRLPDGRFDIKEGITLAIDGFYFVQDEGRTL